jgi:protein CpxP
MKTLKVLAIATICCLTTHTWAQEREKMDPQQMAQKQTDNIKQHVTGITSDQEAKILVVEQDFSKAAQDARASSNGDRDAMRSKMAPLREDRDTKIKAILTDAQYTQYTQMEKERQQGGGRGSHQ